MSDNVVACEHVGWVSEKRKRKKKSTSAGNHGKVNGTVDYEPNYVGFVYS